VRRTRVVLTVAILAALALRLALLWHGRDKYWSTYEVRYDEVARSIVAGKGFAETGVMDLNISELTGRGPFLAPRPPLYPLFLAGIYLVFGRHPLAVGGVQAVLSVATGLLCFAAARRLAGPSAGTLAAGLSLFYPYHVYHDLWLGDAALAGLLLLAWLLLSWRLARSDNPAWGIPIGAIIGLSVLLRPAMGLLLVATALWLKLGVGLGWGRSAKHTAVIVGAAVVVMLPWTVRNYRAFGAVVPVCTYGGYAFWVGNNPVTEHCLRTGVEVDQPAHVLLALIGDSLRGLGELEQQRWFYKEGWSFIVSHPGAFVRLIPWKVWRFWGWDVYPKPAEASRTIVHGATYLPLAALAVLGMTAVFRTRRRQLTLMLMLYALLTVFHFFFYSYTRYRKPFDHTLAIVAAPGLLAALPRSRSTRRRNPAR
jgi:4-amino-4-deoxy-L-arabinose transferase-like glycosyltransferase